LQHTLSTMNDGGRAAVVLDSGALTRGSGSKNEDKERNIRKWYVEHDLVEGIILLPENLFYNTTAAGVIVILSKRKFTSRKGKMVMLNAGDRFVKGKPKNHISSEDILEIASLFVAGEESSGQVAVITTDDARGADYNLSPTRWVARSGDEQEVGDVDSLLGELLELDARAHHLTGMLGRALEGVRRVST
jgi:type I restriction enzyme M protein